MKKYLPTLLVVIMLLFGFALLFYPDVSTWMNSRQQAGLIDEYERNVAALQQAQIDALFRRAEEINEDLSHLPPDAPLLITHWAPLPDDYMQILNVGGMMARVEIPAIELSLPVYHTTTNRALDRGVGHLEGTSFPIGGYNTHSVLTAHSGLPNARLFTDLEGNVTEGDVFFIHVLNRTLAYKVDQVLVVWPHEIEALRIEPGADLVTLITCTPYGINTERLLVRGRRIPYETAVAIVEEQEVDFVANRVDMRIYIFLGFFALFILGFMIYQIIIGRRTQNPVPVPAHPGMPRPARPAAPAPLQRQEVNTPRDYPEWNNAGPIDSVYTQPINAPPNIYSPPIEQMAANTMSSFEQYTASAPVGAVVPPSSSEPRSSSLLEQYMAKGTGAGAHINRHAHPTYMRPQPRSSNLPITGRAMAAIKTNKIIAAACAMALVLVVGIGIWALRPSNPVHSPQDAISGFVSRLEDYRETHNERVVAEMMAQWEESGELGFLNLDALDEDPFARVLQQVKEYNRQVFERGQPHISNPFSYSQSGISLGQFGFDEEMIGYITIPRIDTVLPIFMGASQENLHRGIAHLTGTSLPVGGENTNSVIAGYMELGRNQKLRGIDQLTEGDELRVTNFYETIIYTVVEIRSIHPLQTEALMIQDGKDLITLLTYQQDSPEHWFIVVAQRAYAVPN